MRRYAYIICLLVLPLALVAKPYTVVIDAGHGGKDAGAVGHVLKLQEKNLNLEVSLRLASKLRTAFPEMNVVLTRSSDVFLPLQDRADIVNKNNADLFICVHTNAAEGRSAHGAETFILGTERMEDNLDVAMRENAVMKLEKDYQTAYQGFDPNSVDSYIMFELMQNQYMDQSLQFASLVQNRLVTDVKRDDRGVRQAAFWVLLKSACPSVLVEMGFISNKDEEEYLASDKGKREVADAIYQAFCKYYEVISGNKPRVHEQTDQVKDTVKMESSTISQDHNKKKVIAEEKQVEKHGVKKVGEQEVQQVEIKDDKKLNKQVEKQIDVPAVKDTVVVEKCVEKEPCVSFRVQIFATVKELKEGDVEFKGLKGCVYTRYKQWYRYTYGNCSTREEAEALCKELQQKFPGCFVVQIQ